MCCGCRVEEQALVNKSMVLPICTVCGVHSCCHDDYAQSQARFMYAYCGAGSTATVLYGHVCPSAKIGDRLRTRPTVCTRFIASLPMCHLPALVARALIPPLHESARSLNRAHTAEVAVTAGNEDFFHGYAAICHHLIDRIY